MILVCGWFSITDCPLLSHTAPTFLSRPPSLPREGCACSMAFLLSNELSVLYCLPKAISQFTLCCGWNSCALWNSCTLTLLLVPWLCFWYSGWSGNTQQWRWLIVLRYRFEFSTFCQRCLAQSLDGSLYQPSCHVLAMPCPLVRLDLFTPFKNEVNSPLSSCCRGHTWNQSWTPLESPSPFVGKMDD